MCEIDAHELDWGTGNDQKIPLVVKTIFGTLAFIFVFGMFMCFWIMLAI